MTDKEKIISKIKHYCAYQERSHKEVREKLYNSGIYRSDAHEIISILIEEGYLNEERFARAFAGGKFRVKKWGRNKITFELKSREVSDYNIKAALKEIDEDEYLQVLQTLLLKKWDELKGEQYFSRMNKAKNYLIQKGFEWPLIQEALNQLKTRQESK